MGMIEGTGSIYCEQACEAVLHQCRSEGLFTEEESPCDEQHRRCLQTCEEIGRVQLG